MNLFFEGVMPRELRNIRANIFASNVRLGFRMQISFHIHFKNIGPKRAITTPVCSRLTNHLSLFYHLLSLARRNTGVHDILTMEKKIISQHLGSGLIFAQYHWKFETELAAVRKG